MTYSVFWYNLSRAFVQANCVVRKKLVEMEAPRLCGFFVYGKYITKDINTGLHINSERKFTGIVNIINNLLIL